MLNFLANSIITPLLPFVLTLVGVILYAELKCFPITELRRILSELFKRGENSSWQALAVALAGTLGVGNIVGVAYAITTGGAGALFWMWISALLAMIIKYAETLLAIRYRREDPADRHKLPALRRHIGGAMYYIPHRPVAILFALLCIASSFTVGNLLQAKAIGDAFQESFSLTPYLTGALLAVITLSVTWRGIGRITRFCSVIIPALSIVYLGMCGVILVKNAAALPTLFQNILREAFSLKAIGGGIGGSTLLHAMKIGFSKGLVTNEAGCGTAPIAHASADTENGVKQGLLGIVEVFFDTIVLCTASGLVFLLALNDAPSASGYALVTLAFETLFGSSARYLLPTCIFCFVLATLVSWSYYGKSSLEYLTRSRLIGKLYLSLFAGVTFLGAIGSAEIFWQLSDVTLGLMTLINVGYILYFLQDIRIETAEFFNQKRRQ